MVHDRFRSWTSRTGAGGDLALLLTPLGPVVWWQAQALLATVGVGLLAVMHPLLIRSLVDALSAGRPVRAVLLIGSTLAALQLLRSGVSVVARERTAFVAHRVALRARDRLYTHALRLCATLPPANARGDLLHRLTGDVKAVETLFARVLVQACAVAVAAGGAVVGLLILDARLALLALLAVPLFVLATRRAQATIRRLADEGQAGQAGITTLLSERLTSLETVQLCPRVRIERRAAFRAARRSFAATMRHARANARLWGAVELVTGTTAALVLTLGAVGVLRDALTLGSLLAFYLYVEQLFGAIDTGTAVAGTASESLAGARRAAGVLRAAPAVSSGMRRIPTGGGPVALCLESVDFAYPGGGPVLIDVSLRVAAGEHVAIVGTSGSGKSTLVRLLARLVDPNTGRVTLDGRDLRQLDLAALRRAVRVVPQASAVFSGTLADNLRSDGAPPPDLATLRRAVELACIDARLLEKLARGAVGEAGAALSGGERQRVALARLFAGPLPRALIVDEPTAWLDATTAAAVWAHLRAFAAGRTLIAVTHSPSAAASFPRVIRLEAGHVVTDSGVEHAAAVAPATAAPGRTVPPHLEVA